MENTKGIATAALVISLVALVLGWTAFNRSGANLEEIIAREAEKAKQNVEETYQEGENAVRDETSEALRKAANDAAVDKDPNSVGE